MSKLTSTTEPGEGFGAFNLPLTFLELTLQLDDGVPCEVPFGYLGEVARMLHLLKKPLRLSIETDGEIVQITPKTN